MNDSCKGPKLRANWVHVCVSCSALQLNLSVFALMPAWLWSHDFLTELSVQVWVQKVELGLGWDFFMAISFLSKNGNSGVTGSLIRSLIRSLINYRILYGICCYQCIVCLPDPLFLGCVGCWANIAANLHFANNRFGYRRMSLQMEICKLLVLNY